MYLSPVYTAAPAVADERVGAVFAALDSLGIPYIRFEHDATATMAVSYTHLTLPTILRV